MKYRIEYESGKCATVVYSRKDLLKYLKRIKGDRIVDISKVYKTGVSDSVLEAYEKYIQDFK